MSQLFQFKSATATSIEYSGSDYLYIINNIAWTNIDIDTIEFGQLLDIVAKVNAGEIYALRRTRLFDALDVKLGVDVSGNYAPTIAGSISEWVDGMPEETDGIQIRKINVIDSRDIDIVSYDEDQKKLNFDFSELSGSIELELDSEPGKIKKLVIENDTSDVFTYDEAFNILTFNVDGINGKEGFVCITNVTASDPDRNIGSKVFTSDGNVFESGIGDTTDLSVSVLAITGKKSLKPEWVRVNGYDVDLVQHTTENLWTGTVNLTVEDPVTGIDDIEHFVLEAVHSEGATDTAKIYYQQEPTVTSLLFSGTYPQVGQTSYPEDRQVNVAIETDLEFIQVEVVSDSNNACKYQLTPEFTATTSKVITCTTASANGPRGVILRVKDVNGSWSGLYNSYDYGIVDHVNVISLDDNLPVFTVTGIAYPDGQQALKDVEQAEIQYTYSDVQELELQYLGLDLTIPNSTPNPGDAIYVNRNASGSGYNISVNNYRFIVSKLSNDTYITVDGIVQIANDDAIISLFGAHVSSRLRSGGNNGTSEQSYAITISSNQRLLNTPILTPGVGGGTLSGVSWVGANVGDGRQYTGRSLRVHDSLTRGSYSFTISSVTNLAGRVTAVISSGGNYTIGGFVSRSGTFDAGVAYDDIGVNVSGLNNAAKLLVTISAITGTYAANTTDSNYTSGNHIFTIVSTGSPTVFSSTGNAIRINEPNTVASNTTGLLPYTIEELA